MRHVLLKLEAMLCALEALEGERCIPFCMLEAVEVILRALEVLEVMRCVLWVPEVVPYLPEVLEGVRCLCRSVCWRLWRVCAMYRKRWRGMLYLLEVPDVMRCVLLCMLEAVEYVRYVLELVVVVFHALKVLEGVRCMPLCMLEPWRAYAVCWSCWR